MEGNQMMPSDSMASLLDLASRAARAAGELVMQRSAGVRTGTIETKSSSTDLVTEVDRASERLIVDLLLGERPDDAILGEEDGTRAGTSGVRWLIDPIDGTTNFVYGHTGFAVSIAAEVDGRVEVGVVFDPVANELFSAVRTEGAHRNGVAIQVNENVELAHALVSTGFSPHADRRREQAQILVDVLPAVRDIRRMGGAAIDLCSVACGRVDAFYHEGLGEWDYGAGALIAEEAGARVGDLAGGPPSTVFVVCAAASVAPAFENVLVGAGARPS